MIEILITPIKDPFTNELFDKVFKGVKTFSFYKRNGGTTIFTKERGEKLLKGMN